MTVIRCKTPEGTWRDVEATWVRDGDHVRLLPSEPLPQGEPLDEDWLFGPGA